LEKRKKWLSPISREKCAEVYSSSRGEGGGLHDEERKKRAAEARAWSKRKGPPHQFFDQGRGED